MEGASRAFGGVGVATGLGSGWARDGLLIFFGGAWAPEFVVVGFWAHLGYPMASGLLSYPWALGCVGSHWPQWVSLAS